MWTADSIDITADQICWTADGYDGCAATGGGGGGAFHGQWKPPYDYKKYDREYDQSQLESRIQREDAEISEFIVLLLSKGIL